MIQLLQSIVDAISAVWQFFINSITSLINLIMMIPGIISSISSMLVVLPSYAAVYFTAGISLTVILFMLNKEK